MTAQYLAENLPTSSKKDASQKSVERLLAESREIRQMIDALVRRMTQIQRQLEELGSNKNSADSN